MATLIDAPKATFGNAEAYEEAVAQQYQQLVQDMKRRARMREIYAIQVERACRQIAESRELLLKINQQFKL